MRDRQTDRNERDRYKKQTDRNETDRHMKQTDRQIDRFNAAGFLYPLNSLHLFI